MKSAAANPTHVEEVTIILHYPSCDVSAVVNTLLQLPDRLKPKHYGLDEGVKNELDVVSNEHRFKAFLKIAPGGFFLYATRAVYGFRIFSDGETELYVEGVNSDEAKLLMRVLSPLGAAFGYAAEDAEVKHRNRLVKKIEHGTHEAWFGRDWKRYLPGVYWLTLIPDDLALKHAVPIDALNAVAEHVEELGPHLRLFQFFARPEDWQAHAIALDDWCARTPGVFSIQNVKQRFFAAGSFLETMAILREWK